MLEYTTPEKINEKLSRKQVEKIVYSSGKEIEFYDKVYLKDGAILLGKIIKKNETFVEYNPAGAIPYDRIEISGIIKISYDDGREENFIKSDITDLIYFTDGKIVKASGIIINQINVEFLDENKSKQFYGRNMIDKVIYKDGKTVYMTDTNQGESTKDISAVTKSVYNASKTFLEFESGWNGYSGTGMRLDYLLIGNFSINASTGLGLWGYRVSGNLRYYVEYPFGLAFSLGSAYNTGGPYEDKMEVQDPSDGDVRNEKVKFDLKPVTCINASILYSFQVNESDRFYIETGYSYALQKENYTYESETGFELSETSIDVMNFLYPGGFIISAGYAIAF